MTPPRWLGHAVLILVVVGGCGWWVSERAERVFAVQHERHLRQLARLVPALLDSRRSWDEQVAVLGQPWDVTIECFDADQRPLTRTFSRPGPRVVVAVTGAAPLAYVAVSGAVPAVQERADWAWAWWIGLGLSALVALVPAVELQHRYVQPLATLTDGARRIARGDYGYRLTGDGASSPLAQTFNAMSDQLRVQFAQLEEDREQLRTILSGMVEGVVALDAEQRLLFANERAAHLLEFDASRVVGRKLWEVVRQRTIQDAVERALRDDGPQRLELDWTGPMSKHLALYVARLDGAPAHGAILVLHDTTELRRLERVRQEFVANVSHELKTPLAVIKANVETLNLGAIDDLAHRDAFLNQIEEQADRLHALILDLLDLARIESGAEQLELGNVDVAALLSDAGERQLPRLEAKQQTWRAPATGALWAWADASALVHVFDNLLDNAIKYTPAGGTLSARVWADPEWVRVEISDTGIGIPERDLPHIFERFYRVDKARSRELGGTGLGLSIVKHLVQLLKGHIRVTSQVGQGTTFVVTLPPGRN
jgi:two-component system phosphate regulon sensor histidine kinase PhoR